MSQKVKSQKLFIRVLMTSDLYTSLSFCHHCNNYHYRGMYRVLSVSIYVFLSNLYKCIRNEQSMKKNNTNNNKIHNKRNEEATMRE